MQHDDIKLTSGAVLLAALLLAATDSKADNQIESANRCSTSNKAFAALHMKKRPDSTYFAAE